MTRSLLIATVIGLLLIAACSGGGDVDPDAPPTVESGPDGTISITAEGGVAVLTIP